MLVGGEKERGCAREETSRRGERVGVRARGWAREEGRGVSRDFDTSAFTPGIGVARQRPAVTGAAEML